MKLFGKSEYLCCTRPIKINSLRENHPLFRLGSQNFQKENLRKKTLLKYQIKTLD